MKCDKAIRLIDKLADGEANPGERAEAEAHLASCEDCRSHYQFVRALETASEQIELSEPPEAYWQQFPAKVLTRIEREERSERTGFWQTLLTPSMFRLVAVGATLVLAVAVGISVYREDPSLLEPRIAGTEQAPMAPGKQAADETDQKAVEGDDSEQRDPELAPDELRRAGASAPAPADEPVLDELRPLERSVEAAELRVTAEDSFQDAAAPKQAGRRSRRPAPSPAEPPSESTSAEEELTEQDERPERPEQASADSVRQQLAPEAEPAGLTGQVSAPPQAVRASNVEAGNAVLASAADRCAQWRRYLADNDEEASETREARYQVTLCSLRSYESEPNDDTRREAIRDADAFLAIESDTERADEIRLRLEPLRQ